MIKKNIKYFAVLALGLVACEPEFDNPIDESGVYASGEADFSTYVALGNSLTAGYADGALYITGQENSYPNILAQQFKLAGGGEFTQPLMADNTGGLLLGNGNALPNRFVLAFDEQGNPSPAVYTGAAPTTDVTNRLTGSFNNLGAPGAKSFHLVAEGYGNVSAAQAGLANPYYARFASSDNTSVIGDATSQNPTFFSLWIGNNDILSYATSGGTGVDRTGDIDVLNYQNNDITDPNVFAGVYNELVTKLTANGAKGVVLSLPSVTSIPFFTFVGLNPLPLSADQVEALDQSQLPTLHNLVIGAAFQNGIITQAEYQSRLLSYEVGNNNVLTTDEALTDLSGFMSTVLPTFGVDPTTTAIVSSIFGQARQTQEGDLVLLDAGGKLGIEVNPLTGEPAEGTNFFTGINYPADNAVLEPIEQEAINNARIAYNATIKAIADSNGLAFYDVAADLAVVANTGLPFDGGVITSQFVSGGGFSLDGVHPTPRAHAVVANGIIKSIESKYGANLPMVNPGDYGTVTLSNEIN